MTDPIQAFTAAKNALDGLRLLKNYGEEITDISKRGEFMRIIGELSMELAETQLKLSEQIRENDSLKGKIIELEKAKEIKLVARRSGYYQEDGEGPFCTGCYDDKRKLIRLIQPGAAMLGTMYQCPICQITTPFS